MRNFRYSSVVCFFIVLLVCLSTGFGSWLETNSLFYTANSSVGQYLTVFKLVLYTPLNEANRAYLTFGLWRYCIYDSTSFLCSPVKMNFDIDTISIISNISNPKNDHQLPTLSASSYVRLVPLLITTLVAVISLGVCSFLLPGNSKKTLQRRALFRLTSLLSFIGAILTSITLGITLNQYRADIKYACSLLEQQQIQQGSRYICSSYTPGIETILLGISIGLFIISAVCCVICSLSPLSKSSRMQHTNADSNFSVCTDTNHEQATEINEKQIASLAGNEYDYNNETQQTQRMSLRPPPPNQKRTIIIADKFPVPSSVAGVSNTEGMVPVDATGLVLTTTRSSEFLDNQDILLPPNLPFASRRTNQAGGSSNQNRPLSNGSNNTFGALCGNGSHPNSPSADETNSQASSYMDLHHNQYYRNDSNISAGTLTPTHTNSNSNLIYTVSGTMSNHTLGATLYTNSKSGGCYGNPSSSGDEDDKINHGSQSNTRSRQFGSTSSSMHSSIIPDNASSGFDNMLYKRIEDYLHVQDNKKDSSSSLSN